MNTQCHFNSHVPSSPDSNMFVACACVMCWRWLWRSQVAMRSLLQEEWCSGGGGEDTAVLAALDSVVRETDGQTDGLGGGGFQGRGGSWERWVIVAGRHTVWPLLNFKNHSCAQEMRISSFPFSHSTRLFKLRSGDVTTGLLSLNSLCVHTSISVVLACLLLVPISHLRHR